MNITEVKQGLRYLMIPGFRQAITPFLWGKPGIGKSQCVLQVAKELSKLFGKEFMFIDLRLSQLESADIRGIPEPDLAEGICRWLPPEFLPFEGIKKFKGTQGVLLLDEFNRARTDVLQAAFQLVLDRQVGMHRVMDSWFLCAAGNLGREDKTDVNEMDAALKNRFAHFEVELNFDTWVEWARGAKVHEDVLGYIQAHPDHLYYTIKEKDNVFVTPRSWEKFSDVLKANVDVDPKIINLEIGKTIINGCSMHFNKYLEQRDVIKAEEVLKDYDKVKRRIETMQRDQVLMLNNEISSYIVKRASKEKKEVIEKIKLNLIKYMDNHLEKDNKMAFLQSMMKACKAEGVPIMGELLKEHAELAKDVVSTLSKKRQAA